MIELCKRKSKYKERTEQENRNEPTKNISRKCLVVSEEIERDRLTEIVAFRAFEPGKAFYQEKNKYNKTYNWQPGQTSHPWREAVSNKYITTPNIHNGWSI